ncbi:MAG: arginine--tRNA ligase [Candidatus Pacebacteria bacterium]|nr:arginine--tRNA ligase [Candidatus Paceibacterota bacterium]MDR3583356.1 arginine--tRNA ligase [Candidatus Paceibacterota bacterium]
MKEEIKKLLEKAVNDLKSQENWPAFADASAGKPEIEVDYPKNESFGDYTTNVAMTLGKILKKNPLKVAEEIVSFLGTPKEFSKIEIVKPGYINFYLSKKYLRGVVGEINELGEKYGNNETGRGEKVHLDFVSANPTGPVTLGNGRGGTLGDAIANILQKNGCEVWREYYVNDFGNQIKVLGHSVLKDEEAQYKGDYIDEISGRIKSKDPFEVGQVAAKIILEEIIKPSMEKMEINFDEYFSEKSLHVGGEVEKAFALLKEKDLIYEKDGAVWFRAEKFGDEKDRVIKKSTGEVTYFGGDIAYHKNKFERGFSRAIDVWGADHHGDVKRVLGAVSALGYGGKLEIIITQLLRVIKDGKEFRMSKRKGTYVSIDDLLSEVGHDAVRFFFLMNSRDTHMTFDLDLAKEKSEKNPVFYVQYAHARICSILKKSEIRNPKSETNYKSEIQNPKLELLTHEKELGLIRELNRFPELVAEIARTYEVHKLPYYAIKLADKFHSFYNELLVLDPKNPELTAARLELVKSVRIVLAETLWLIGVSSPEHM